MIRGRGRAFTLVELLVVIAIIALLIAILLPVLHRARRAAEVLASPIAYTGVDGTVHLTDPGGGTDVGIAGPSTVSCPVCHSPPQWSPSGQMLAITTILGPNTRGPGVLYFADPVPNRVRRYITPDYFMAWTDSDNVLEGRPRGPIETWGAADHRMRKQVMPTADIYSMTATPTGSAAPYVGAVRLPDTSFGIAYIKGDLSLGKVVWSGGQTIEEVERPRADPLGEYVAWTEGRGAWGKIALKEVHEPAWKLPNYIGTQFRSAYFCDWAENGNLLANVSDTATHWNLAIFDRKGRLVRKLSTPSEPALGAIATWRKYGHR